MDATQQDRLVLGGRICDRDRAGLYGVSGREKDPE